MSSKSPMRFSVIVPVYNRPDEINELLMSLTKVHYKSFEVIIVEDGSDLPCKHVVKKYQSELTIRYFTKENSGQGFSRNFGFKRAEGDYFVVFDSDCIIPPHYFDAVNTVLDTQKIDCWGGPDRSHPSFSPVQKAISYSMTSFLTTGGIRGKKGHVGSFHPRSFNMGISKRVFELTGGYRITRMGEDIEFSIRIQKAGFRTLLIPEAFVYHKRRTDFRQFFSQLFFFGRARINIGRFHPEQLKLFHALPLFFTLGILLLPPLFLLSNSLSLILLSVYFFYGTALFIDAYRFEKDLKIAIYSILAGFIQLTAYGSGFAKEWMTGTSIKD